MQQTRVRERSNYKVVKIPSNEPLKVVAEILLVKSISSVIIVEDGLPVGIVTERDLIRAFYKNHNVGISDPVSLIMSSPLSTIDVGASVQEAIQEMIIRGYRQLGVTNNKGKLVGMCSMGDLIMDLANANTLLQQTQYNLSKQGGNEISRVSEELEQLINELREKLPLPNEFHPIPNYELQELLYRLKNMVKDRAERKTEEPKMILLTNPDGLNLYSKKVSKISTNGQLMSGFFYAINQWMKEIVVEDGFIDKIKFRDYTIAIRSINKYLLCYMFKGDSYDGFKTLDNLVQRLQTDSQLTRFFIHQSNNISCDDEKKLNQIIEMTLSNF